MSFVVLSVLFGASSVSYSWRGTLFPALPLLLVIGTLAGIVISHSLRKKKPPQGREEKGDEE